MDWQLLLVLVAVGASVAYLARLGWRTWRRRGCTAGCGCAKAPAPGATQVTLIPPEQLGLRKRA